ncbi:tRNA lysidine(34) synthetase TilS [Chryseotalea sanaruensis]|uniref:tRNA(Ile)-lysidine synthase n=1 Tax=Chryseotalea sanaruensis TaxID=2482724 RepID=A0A401UA62_9BACT|nr:tRNA lysidine(34) synthetase TilS [Chryseotalea sanaruensis]GCC51734.1 tRNA lysidine(34) synthetase TilS [Chryseotalea sanaruensis]
MLKQFISHLSDKHNIQAPAKVLLAVSGGLDSMVMLELFHQSGFSVGIAHVNFELRGEESDGDEALVKNVCQQKNIPFFTTHFFTKDYANEKGISVQMAARELRYKWFESLAEEHNYEWIATAHHLNDSIETAVFNWTNAASLAGLCGIAAQHGKIIRPLLFARRKELEDFAKENSVIWREDSSNDSDVYKRNFIRHQIIPKLKELNPSLESSFMRGQRKLQGELSFLNHALQQWKNQFVSIQNDVVNIDKKGFNEIDAAAIILYKVAEPFGFNFDVCEEVLQALHEQSGKRFLSNSYQMIVDRSKLLISKQVDELDAVLIERDQTDAFLGNWHLKIRVGTKQVPINDLNVAMLDFARLQFPLKWRQWQAGDTFYPLGMKGSKKVSDLLIDNKVSLVDKTKVTVLTSGEEIIWVVGHRLDERFKLSENTKETLILTLNPYFT